MTEGARRPVFAGLVTAAGASTRVGGLKKEYRAFSSDDAGTLSVLGASVSVLADSGAVDVIVVSVPPRGEAEARAALPARLLERNAAPPVLFVEGGPSRRRSVHNALRFLARRFPVDYVLIHDGARPWLDEALVLRLAAEVLSAEAVIPVMPLVETPKEIDASGSVTRHLRRASVVSAQTPQAFAFARALAAHESAAVQERERGIEYTDDAEVWGAFQGPVRTIPGDPANKKITFPEDLPVVEARP